MTQKPGEAEGEPTQVGLLLLPSFSLLGVIAAIDVMRHANRLSGHRLYGWSTYSTDGTPRSPSPTIGKPTRRAATSPSTPCSAT